MKYGAGVLAALALAGLASGAARAQDPIAEVKKRSEAYNKAVETKDRKALEGVFHPDGVFIAPDGRMGGRKFYIDDNLAWMRGRKIAKLEVAELRYRVYGETVIETGDWKVTGTVNGKPFVHRVRYSGTWVKVKGVWLLTTEQATPYSPKK